MQNYYRITAYHKEMDYSIIMDSCGRYNALWEFSADLIRLGYSIMEASKLENIQEINMAPCLDEDSTLPYLRSWGKGKPVCFEYEANGKNYRAIRVKGHQYALRNECYPHSTRNPISHL